MNMKKILTSAGGAVFAGIFTYIGFGIITRFLSALLVASIIYVPLTTLLVGLGVVSAVGVLFTQAPSAGVRLVGLLCGDLWAAVKNIFTVSKNVGDKIAETLIDKMVVRAFDAVFSMSKNVKESYLKISSIKAGDVTVKNMLQLLKSGLVNTVGLCGAGVAGYLAVNAGAVVVPFLVNVMMFNYPMRIVVANAYVMAVAFMAITPDMAAKFGSRAIEKAAALAVNSVAASADVGMGCGQKLAQSGIDKSSNYISYLYGSGVAKGNEAYAKAANASNDFGKTVSFKVVDAAKAAKARLFA